MQFIIQRWLPLFLICAVGYIASEPLRPFPLHYLVKAVPIFILMIYVGSHLQGTLRTQTLLALLFSAGGDVMLSMTFPNNFIAGLGSFLIAQIFYAILFLQYRSIDRAGTKSLITALAAVYAVVMAGLILPDDPTLKIAVLCYLTVITAMAISVSWAWERSPLHIVGAFLFVISDSFIAWNMFRAPLPASSFLIMSTYYAAQLLLAIGIVRHISTQSRGEAAG